MTETFIPYKVSALKCLRETVIDRLSLRLFFRTHEKFQDRKIDPYRKKSAVPIRSITQKWFFGGDHSCESPTILYQYHAWWQHRFCGSLYGRTMVDTPPDRCHTSGDFEPANDGKNGHQYLDTFFQICSRLLKANGMMLLQAITIVDQVFDTHKRSVDFIKRYIFTGSCIPSIHAIMNSIVRKTDLKLFHLEDITPHYFPTFAEWRKRFFERIDDVRKIRFPDTFIRMWEYYLCYCEGGVAERYINDVQMLFTKPMCRREPLVPSLI